MPMSPSSTMRLTSSSGKRPLLSISSARGRTSSAAKSCVSFWICCWRSESAKSMGRRSCYAAHRMGRALVVLTSWLAVAPAYAQGEPGAARKTETSSIARTSTSADILDVEVAPPMSPPCPADSERVYQKGFDELVDDDPLRAVELFGEVVRACPEHRLAREMKRYAIARADKLGLEAELPGEPETEQPTLLAWGELIAFQTLHGIGQGVMICLAAGCEDARALAVGGFAGASLGAGLSILGFRKIRSGQASAINSGTAWGIWNGIALLVVTEPNERVGPGMISGMMLAGTALGTGAALFFEPRNGAVSFANSTGIWLGVSALWIMIAAKADFEETIIPVEMAVTNVGLLLGAIISPFFEISRGRVLLIDAGGIVGMLLGVGITALINNEFPSAILGTLSAIGTVGGVIGTYFLTA